jgi:hypothetical protein
MKRLAIGLAATLVFLTVSFAAPKDESFTGEIMDSQCALLKGHEKMAKQGESLKDCTIRCVGLGGKYVLFDRAKSMRYQLDDQKKAMTFAGAQVTVVGSYDAATKTIHTTDIKPAS